MTIAEQSRVSCADVSNSCRRALAHIAIVPLMACALLLVCSPIAVCSQALGGGVEYVSSDNADLHGAAGGVVWLRPFGQLELRVAYSEVSQDRTDVTCGFFEPGCAAEPLRSHGEYLTVFPSWLLRVLSRPQYRIWLAPELGFARFDGTRVGENSGRNVVARGDYIGIGLRAGGDYRPGSRILLRAELGMRRLSNPAIGESLDRYDPYREAARATAIAIGVLYQHNL